MIILKTLRQIDAIREAGHLVAQTLDFLEKLIAPGVIPTTLDREADAFIRRKGGTPAFLNYKGYPASICVSVNDTVIHGIPSNSPLKNGDIVGCDLGVTLNGYVADASRTFPVGTVSRNSSLLLQTTKEALNRAISAAVAGNYIKDIAKAITAFVEPHGYGIVESFGGHGVGIKLHEDPHVPHKFDARRGANPRLKAGMVLAIEPMINQGSAMVKVLPDGWTVKTADGRLSAHFEHTIAIGALSTEILTVSV